jgi:hypothetical protein
VDSGDHDHADRDLDDVPDRPQTVGEVAGFAPGECDNFLDESAAVARNRAWAQMQVTIDPASYFQMNGATSPRP